MDDAFIEWRLIKNPITGEKDTVIGKRGNGTEESVLIDNPIYLEWLAQGKSTIEELEE
jgi:hypothetical protein